MEYQNLNAEEREAITERLDLVTERIHELAAEPEVCEPFRAYFKGTAAFIVKTEEVLRQVLNDSFCSQSRETLQKINEALYEDILPEHYKESYANPDYACITLGEEYGTLLSMLYAELRSLIPYAYEGDVEAYTCFCELFIQVYTCFNDEEGTTPKEVQQAIYWFFHDYSELFTERSVCEMVDASRDFFTRIVMDSDLQDLKYLYYYGEPIGENEIRMAEYMNQLPQEKIQAMADTYTEGYRIGFITTGKDLSIKSTVNVEYAIGMERMVRAAIANFEKMGLKPTIYRNAFSSFRNRGNSKRGCYATSVNRQFDYDHKADKAVYLDKAFVERRLETLRTVYEDKKELAAGYAGPAVIEVFGETLFEPENKKTACHYSDKQNELNVYYASQAGQITNQYIKGEERSFTIIAYPLPEISENADEYEKIFHEIVRINTLDYNQYKEIQQTIIDALDSAEYVHVKGCGNNQTDMRVSLQKITNPQKETVFENCLADVNIPLGEVFTSPVLKGTEGILNVSSVYLNDLKFINLKVSFKDGMVTDYSCDNFEDAKKGRQYFKENVLLNHDTLPIGEFAIGTNTTAYVMANQYDIVYKLPILIVEKMGPHFAIGDTCYSRAEDNIVYNPNGKEIISRDNEISILRKTEPEKAYFNCHTDITIPYDEIGSISAVSEDGSETVIIENGRFVLAGCEELNKPFLK